MKIRLLPSIAGRESQAQCLTSFLLNGRVAVDGGSLGFALTGEAVGRIRDIVITHAHSDHTASLPIYVAEAFTQLDSPIIVYCTREVEEALRRHIFNDQIWPDFEQIHLAGGGPALRFHTIEHYASFQVNGLEFTPVPVNHPVPTVGLLVEDEGAAIVLTSDTYVTDEIWEAARRLEKLKAVFVDVSYPNELSELAAAAKHLTPELLKTELTKLSRKVDVYAVHIKPSNREEVIRQLRALNDPTISVAVIDHEYEV